MPKNKAENIQGILRYFSNKKPSPNEKAKVAAIRRKTYSKAKNLREPSYSGHVALNKHVLLSFVEPSDYPLKSLYAAYNFSVANSHVRFKMQILYNTCTNHRNKETNTKKWNIRQETL